MIDETKVEVLKLTEELLDSIQDFDCADPDLNEFIKEDALRYQSGKIAVTYLMFYEGRPVGFFCLSNDAVEIKGSDKKYLIRQGKSQRTYPAMKIGRLGVAETYWHSGFGSFMIQQAIGITLLNSGRAGCRYITVDAYNRDIPVKFYTSNGFRKLLTFIEREQIPMYIDLLKI